MAKLRMGGSTERELSLSRQRAETGTGDGMVYAAFRKSGDYKRINLDQCAAYAAGQVGGAAHDRRIFRSFYARDSQPLSGIGAAFSGMFGHRANRLIPG